MNLIEKIDFFIIQQNFRFFNSFNIIVKIILIIWFEYLFSENFLKSIDKFVKIIYNKVKGKIITTVILPLYVFVFKTTVRAGAVVLLYCTFVANIAIMTIIANKAKKNFFCICTMLNFHKHSSFLQSCPIWRTENKKWGQHNRR